MAGVPDRTSAPRQSARSPREGPVKRRLIVAALLASYVAGLRPRLLHWGATRHEVSAALPGDELVQARWETTRGIDIAASADDVWPWLVQMGYGRGGWYSFDWLERLGGFGDFADGGSAGRVIPELQALAVGDTVPLSPVSGLTVAVLEPSRALVLHIRMNALTGAVAAEDDKAVLDWTWAFILTEVDDVSCRLLVRVRADCHPRVLWALIPLVLEPIHFGMELKMLQTIKLRAAQPVLTSKR